MKRLCLFYSPGDCSKSWLRLTPIRLRFFVANGGGKHPARNIVGGDFLQLVRLGFVLRMPAE
jgi:hypothetical protein